MDSVWRRRPHLSALSRIKSGSGAARQRELEGEHLQGNEVDGIMLGVVASPAIVDTKE